MPDHDLDFDDTPPRRDPDIPPDAESYEEMPPKARYFAPATPAGRTLPHSKEAEEFLLACCLIDGNDVVSRCIESRVTATSFYEVNNAIIFTKLLGLYQRNAPIDISVLAEELKTSKQLDKVGGVPYLVQITSQVPTTAQASYFIEKVREQATLREIIRAATGAVEDCYGFTGGIEDLAEEVQRKVLSAIESASAPEGAKATPITEYDYPTQDDPNVLLGSDDYLGRGGGMLFVSHAGAGKSSFIMDGCMTWGLGESWAGIRCNGPLKTLIIQAEDSDRYVGKVRRSFSEVKKLTKAQSKQLAQNCVIVKVRGITGAAFFAQLERLVAIHNPDLVVINPIYLYAEGDISKSEAAQPFLVGLDRVNRDMKFGYILVHHTGKPQAKSPSGKRVELDDWETIYMGFGSSYLANWPRCSALLEPRPKSPGRYWLKLGKGGSNAGVTKRVPHGASFRHEPTTRVALRHSKETIDIGGVSRPAIFWEVDEGSDDDEKDSKEYPEKPKGGRTRKYNFAEFRVAIASVCTGEEKRQGFNALHRAIQGIRGTIGKSAVDLLIDDGLESGLLFRSAIDGRYFMKPAEEL